MSFDDFLLAGESKVSSVILVLVQLAQVRGNVGGGKVESVKVHPEEALKIINICQGKLLD